MFMQAGPGAPADPGVVLVFRTNGRKARRSADRRARPLRATARLPEPPAAPGAIGFAASRLPQRQHFGRQRVVTLPSAQRRARTTPRREAD